MTTMDTGSTVLRLPDALRSDVEAAIGRAVSDRWAARLWERDTTLWTADPAVAARIADFLTPETMARVRSEWIS